MKQITAIVQPHMLTDVKRALHALPHFPGYTGLSGDGLIAVSDVAELVRIRTNERGDDAV